MDKKVSIILSTYNEALVIEETINKIFKSFKSIVNLSIELLIYNSGSFELYKGDYLDNFKIEYNEYNIVRLPKISK